MSSLRRGIAPEILLSQIKNTMPYLFAGLFEVGDDRLQRLFPSQVVKDFSEKTPKTLSHVDYFKLCLSAHFLTCGTPVPTDVDNQIRHKLWPSQLPLEDALMMVKLVLECRSWGYEALSTRSVQGLSGHHGEWFTVASAAYSALLQYKKSALVQEHQQMLFDQISDEVNHHSEVFASLWKSGDGVSCLKASAIIAHNFGDLDRVIDMWDLPVGDPLRLQFYKLTSNPFDSNRKLRYLGRLWVAGELYKAPLDGSAMALENHRHFSLRKPKCLRQRPEFLIPIGPFFDDWGRKVAHGLADAEGKSTEQTHEVVEALKYGWSRLPKTVGYGRALSGISDVHPEFSPDAKTLQSLFEKKWNDEALKHMDEIPSRA